ncbi:class I SAM-dependent methyltransferase [Leptospira sp. GIMC2001]|uniref:class I SAM-dependent methyltransferase n=1 Tax=Leptospira sp. GIMC2001 TaxID=1513297 RepID=UPI0023492D05|nr:class I SAM-dependent methyltransferase [Leptospira sp. GIMC2001]WCL49333.1 class I SAM-dependent methyltransferase [Leptospira sp. GIMC2001]
MNQNPSKVKCPLCYNTNGIELYSRQPINREYYHCDKCELIFVSSFYHLDQETEKRRYEKHENSYENFGYIQFLNRSILPTLPFLDGKKIGLDYGCGPGPALSKILSNHGYEMHDYDPNYFPIFPKIKFDFLFCTEVWEHFYNPGIEIPKILSLLKPKSILSIMTLPWNRMHGSENFSEWFYARDDTHVSFFHEKTMEWMSIKWNLELLSHPEERVWIWKTP